MSAPFRALAEPRRREILRLVWDRERAAGEIAAEMDDVSFPAVSQHLKVLRDEGMVEVRKEGRRRIYRARREALGPLAAALEASWAGRLSRLRNLAEARERRKEER
ncbi:MAG TPA: metalloregulator ArsR/SmtB family transcription factor [Gemmatimonadota bacterium]|nr:metalloregulator ArsR/SmtB family transcription factor [Gemmatimonadota bacterium]